MTEDLYFDKYINELASVIEPLFGEPYVNYFNKTVMVTGVKLEDVKKFVEGSKFKRLVHDVSHDYEYGYDEYNDPLTVDDTTVLLYCKDLCENDYNHDCDGCGKCEEAFLDEL